MISKLNSITFYTTPEELREIADNMEKQALTTKLGEEVPKVIKFYQHSQISFVMDQDMRKNNGTIDG